MIWAIVLAAGESRRMGTQKMLLPFGDTTIVGAVVRTASASRVDGTMVVLGADRDAIRDELASLSRRPARRSGAPVQPDRPAAKVSFTVNDHYQLGMLTSIQAGMRALPAGADAAVIMLGDQPFLGAPVVDSVIGAFEAGGRGIVIPTFQGRRGHPVLVDLKYRDEILAIEPLDGLRALMRAHPEDILEVEVADPNILRDMDTPEDYAGLPKPN
jgi:molybdenum cofactor cytidylyltransferase